MFWKKSTSYQNAKLLQYLSVFSCFVGKVNSIGYPFLLLSAYCLEGDECIYVW